MRFVSVVLTRIVQGVRFVLFGAWGFEDLRTRYASPAGLFFQGSGFMVSCVKFRVQSVRLWVWKFEFRVHGFGRGILSLWFVVSGAKF